MPTGLWNRILDVFAPAKIVEFFATSDGQAVLANVAGIKVGGGAALPGGGQELGAYDADGTSSPGGFPRLRPGGQPRRDRGAAGQAVGSDRPTASIKRGVFAAAGDIWISTSTCSGGTPTATTGCSVTVPPDPHPPRRVFPAPITDAVRASPPSTWPLTYPLETSNGTLAVTAVALRPDA